jgi:hypothetical protein
LVERRQISEKEKEEVLKIHGRVCFVTGHPIGPDEKFQYHHIKPYSDERLTHIDNIAPVCEEHHKHVGTMSLQEFRDKLKMEEFFKGSEQRRLDDVLEEKTETFGQKIAYKIDGGSQICVTFFDGTNATFPLHECPATGTKFFHALIPSTNIKNDSDLQPRPLEPKRMWELYRHLLTNTQLAASICRLVEGQVLLFDGQHKAAAQIWLGRPTIECKVYIEPDPRRLKETNLAAHEKLRQMPFYTSTLIRKYGDIFGTDWEEYVSYQGAKTEDSFVRFLASSKGKTRAEAIKEIRMALIKDILESSEPKNKIMEFIAEENRTRKNPLTYHVLQLTFFHEFVVPPPLKVEIESTDDFRKQERNNVIKLLNIMAEETLIGHWNPQLNDAEHKKTERLYSSGALRAWVPLLKDVIAQILRLYEADEKEKVLFREVNEENYELIRGRVRRMFSHKMWIDPNPEIDAKLKINEPVITKQFLSDEGLTASWVLGSES